MLLDGETPTMQALFAVELSAIYGGADAFDEDLEVGVVAERLALCHVAKVEVGGSPFITSDRVNYSTVVAGRRHPAAAHLPDTDPFADDAVTVHVTEIVTSAWETDGVTTSRVGARGEVLGYRVTDSVGTFEPYDSFPEALVGHANLAAQFGEAAADMAARNWWFRESPHMRVSGDH
ncbi:hypothetical protein EXE59_16615 [Nocardioides eburneiflavus]|uniref:Uncharacterized protein n=1 Tax=Nocardioides eburneiflavus TaxID=2518372 RepID=A0A4Z1CCI8_9ACTN|nr:hypothetical protein [Nocardioides eburneiflavus]TGN65396.1 hypothetical protein EXE59_16615 [Nocardioides eburneiflavus]